MLRRVVGESGEIGGMAADLGAQAIRDALAACGSANIVVATGTSQFDVYARLVQAEAIDWSKVTVFHLDEYVGLPIDHGASFRRYLLERFVAPLGGKMTFIPVDGDAASIDAELARLNGLIGDRSIDVCFAGIGENGHLAFNDPPADFETVAPYIQVTLDEACRRQQLGEGWFPTLADVPRTAISMSIRQILAAQLLVLTVPDVRKAAAVKASLEGPLTPSVPASILRTHDNAVIFLDPTSASLLTAPTKDPP